MKVHIINHRCGDDEIEVKNGIRVFDWVGNEFWGTGNKWIEYIITLI